MTDLPVAAFFTDPDRTNAQAKLGQDDMLAFIRQMLGGQAETTLTVASDVATPTRGTHAIDTEGAAASDDLKNLATTNLPDGSFLLIRAVSAARVVTVKHNAGGSGQIALFGAVDAVLDATSKWLLLKRTGANWEEVARFGFSSGGTITAGRGFSANANGTQGGTIIGNGTLRIMGAVYENVAAATTTNLANISNGTSALNITGNNVTITGFSGLSGLPDIPFKVGNGTLTLQTGGNLTIAAGNLTLAANSTGVIRPLTNTTAEIVGAQNANGSALAGGGSGLVFLGAQTVANVASAAVTSNISSTYDEYHIVYENLRPASNATSTLRITVSTDGGGNYSATNYDYVQDLTDSTGGVGQGGGSNQTGFLLGFGGGIYTPGNVTGTGVTGTLRIWPNGSAFKPVIYDASFRGDSGRQIVGVNSGMWTNTTPINAIRFAYTSGNITSGTIRLYGVAKS